MSTFLRDERIGNLVAFGQTHELRDAVEAANRDAQDDGRAAATAAIELFAHQGVLEEAAIPIACHVAAELAADRASTGIAVILMELLHLACEPKPGIMPRRSGSAIGRKPTGNWASSAWERRRIQVEIVNSLAGIKTDGLIERGLAAQAAFAESSLDRKVKRTWPIGPRHMIITELALAAASPSHKTEPDTRSNAPDFGSRLLDIVQQPSRTSNDDLLAVLMASTLSDEVFPWCKGIRAGFAAQILLATGTACWLELIRAIKNYEGSGPADLTREWDEPGMLAHILLGSTFPIHKGRPFPLDHRELSQVQRDVLMGLEPLHAWHESGGLALESIGIMDGDIGRTLTGVHGLDEPREGIWNGQAVAQSTWAWIATFRAAWTWLVYDTEQLIALTLLLGEAISPKSQRDAVDLLSYGLKRSHISERILVAWLLSRAPIPASEKDKLTKSGCQSAHLAFLSPDPSSFNPDHYSLPWLQSLAKALQAYLAKQPCR